VESPHSRPLSPQPSVSDAEPPTWSPWTSPSLRSCLRITCLMRRAFAHVYQRMAASMTASQVRDMARELEDRFDCTPTGPPLTSSKK